MIKQTERNKQTYKCINIDNLVSCCVSDAIILYSGMQNLHSTYTWLTSVPLTYFERWTNSDKQSSRQADDYKTLTQVTSFSTSHAIKRVIFIWDECSELHESNTPNAANRLWMHDLVLVLSSSDWVKYLIIRWCLSCTNVNIRSWLRVLYTPQK